MRFQLIVISPILLVPSSAFATIFGSVRGIIHDYPQHRPIQGAHVTLKAQNSSGQRPQHSGTEGEFEFSLVPIGNYTVTVSTKGFQEMQQGVVVQSNTSPVLISSWLCRREGNRLRLGSSSGGTDRHCDADDNGGS